MHVDEGTRVMSQSNESDSPNLVQWVSCPGGIARQFRVQVAGTDGPLAWQLVGAFRQRAEAEKCVAALKPISSRIRVVECRALPTAA